MTQGTEWTEPERGATGDQLAEAVHKMHEAEQIRHEECDAVYIRLLPRKWRKTNLNLTGHPLNKYDLRRIAEAK